MSKRNILVVQIVLLIFVGFCSLAQAAGEVIIATEEYRLLSEEMRASLTAQMKKTDVQGMTIAIINDREILWAEGFGYADVAKQIPATPGTIYELGSISKLFTATAVMKLAEAGKVDIDRPYRTYVPDFSIQSRFGSIEQITPRSMLTHHSGLPCDYFRGMWGLNPLPAGQILSAIRDQSMIYPTNYIFAYSNLGFGLLGDLVERVSGDKFSTFTDKEIFAPLGMSYTSFVVKPEMKSLVSKGYQGGIEQAPLKLSVPAAGAAHGNALDLAKFMQMMMNQGKMGAKQFLQPRTVAEMWKQQNKNIPLDFDMRIGLAWQHSVVGARQVVGHSGDTIYFHSRLMIQPEDKLGVIVLTNSAKGAVITERVAKELMLKALEIKTKSKSLEIMMLEKPVTKKSLTELKRLAGKYSTDLGLVEVEAKSDGLEVSLFGVKIRLVPTGDSFAVRYLALGTIPIKVKQLAGVEYSFSNIDGHDLWIVNQNGHRGLFGVKVPEMKVSEAWQKRAGKYEYTNLLTGEYQTLSDLQLVYKDGLMLISARIPMYEEMGLKGAIEMVLQPISDSEAILFGFGRNKGYTVKVVSTPEGELLLFSGYRLIKVPVK